MSGYMDRALRAKDPRYAKVLRGLGYDRRDLVTQAEPQQDANDLSVLRGEYQDALGKKAYHGWDADTLREKIAEAKG